MILHAVAKVALIFAAGAISALAIIAVLNKTRIVDSKIAQAGTNALHSNTKSLEQNVRAKTYETIDNAEKNVVGQVLSAVAESPIVAPFVKTKDDVQTVVQEVKNLPDTQKSAFCKQICSE